MGSKIVDDVNKLLALEVGDPFRLKHILRRDLLGAQLRRSDENYLNLMREKYLGQKPAKKEKPNPEPSFHKVTESKADFEDVAKELKSNLDDVIDSMSTDAEKKARKGTSKAIPIGLAVLAIAGIIVSVGLYADIDFPLVGTLDNVIPVGMFDKKAPAAETEIVPVGITDSKCGAGTVLDPSTNACVLPGSLVESVVETSSGCGPGTVLDPSTNSCVLPGSLVESVAETSSGCGPGTVLDPSSNACVLEGTVSEVEPEAEPEPEVEAEPEPEVEAEPEVTHAKCGAGTVYDDDSNTCVLE